MAKPKYLSNFSYSELADLVSRGEYRRFDDQSEVPDLLTPYATYPSPEEFIGMAILSSSTGENPPTIGGIGIQGNDPVYRVRTVRLDDHDGKKHVNADDLLLFRNQEGEPFLKLAAWSTAMLTATIVFYKFSFAVIVLDFSGIVLCGVISFALTLLPYIWLRSLLSRIQRRNLIPVVLMFYYVIIYGVSQGFYLL